MGDFFSTPTDPNFNLLNSIDWRQINVADHLEFDEFREINGEGNNIMNPEWGLSNSEVLRCVASDYSDGFNSLSGDFRLNPRELSNAISTQDPETSDIFLNNRHLTQFAWQWGQFIDHDITLISEDTSSIDLDDDIDIYVPCGDPTFDQNDECNANITMELFRTKPFENSGNNITNPRNQINDITSFIDGSMIYGATNERANELRTFVSGMLKTSTLFDEQYLPFNENNSENAPNTENKFFIGGDVRVNEVISLTAMHTIWVRLHNKIAHRISYSILSSNNNNIDDATKDELVYQYTKLIITGIIQKIVYQDWLPTLFGPTAIKRFSKYIGYDTTVNPNICLIFSSAAFRFGHSMITQKLPIRNLDCSGGNDLELRDAFFAPDILQNNQNFMESLFHGSSCTLSNEIDVFVTDGVRNFLFESAEDDGIKLPLDLVSINIQRGRDHGLPDFNTVREEIGLPALKSFDEISSNMELNQKLDILYDHDINNIDLFIGLLAEDHLNDGSFGETTSKIVLQQFDRLRSGDRFFYQHYIKNGEIKDFINSMTLKQVIEITTFINNLNMLDNNNNIFQNKKAVSIFSDDDGLFLSIFPELTDDFQISIICAILLTIGWIICYIIKTIRNKHKKIYEPIKFESDTVSSYSNSDSEDMIALKN